MTQSSATTFFHLTCIQIGVNLSLILELKTTGSMYSEQPDPCTQKALILKLKTARSMYSQKASPYT